MRRIVLAGLAALFPLLTALAAAAQDAVFVQIESHPTLGETETAARGYAQAIDNINGFRANTGWYAVAAGPYAPQDAAQVLARLQGQGLVPRDAFITDGGIYVEQIYPVGASVLAAPAPVAPVVEAPVPQPVVPVQSTLPDETPQQARQSEAALDREGREALQVALQWFGFYRSGIDGAFGPGTRNAMAQWQSANGYEATGILTTAQRAALLQGYRDQLASLGLEEVTDEAAGIRMQLPMARVAFARYEPPFVHYDNTDGGTTRVLLISQEGTRATLHGLYDIMQTLEIVPLTGDRRKNANDFVLTGQNDRLHSYTYAALQDGMVKGFTVTWAPEEDDLFAKIVPIMRESFRPVGDSALDDTLGQASATQSLDLLSGLEIRRPEKARSGFYLDPRGHVLTVAEGVEGCGRITITGDIDASVAAVDAATGLAVLTPASALAPATSATFLDGVPRLRGDVAVAGFPFEGALGTPTVNFGTLEDLRGLGGETDLVRLGLKAERGEAGGAVLDSSGLVLGVLLPGADTTRALPEDVAFARPAAALDGLFAAAGVTPARAAPEAGLPPEDLTDRARAMAVLVNCWN